MVYEVHAGDRDCYLIDGCLRPALAGGDSLTGSTKRKVKYENPYQDLLNSVMAGGLPSVAKGYMDKVAIPTTMNQATAMGLGRSGGALEAVANQAWKPGVDIMQTILGRPLSPTETTDSRSMGVFDWLGALTGIAGTGLDLYNKWPSSIPTKTIQASPSYDWMTALGA